MPLAPESGEEERERVCNSQVGALHCSLLYLSGLLLHTAPYKANSLPAVVVKRIHHHQKYLLLCVAYQQPTEDWATREGTAVGTQFLDVPDDLSKWGHAGHS